MVMKAFAKNRKSKQDRVAEDALDDIDLGSEFGDDTFEDDDVAAADAHDDFLERLGDLDRFIGTGIASAAPPARAGALVDGGRSTRRLFDAREHGVALAEAPA